LLCSPGWPGTVSASWVLGLQVDASMPGLNYFFNYWVARALSIFWKQVLIRHMVCKYFTHTVGYHSTLLIIFLPVQSFLILCGPIHLFPFNPCFVAISKKSHKNYLCFLLSIL
jgi:hypothetical protein